MPPLCRTPPGQSSGTRQVLLPQPGAWPRFRCPFVNVTTRQQRFGFTHLPGPHLALHRCLFHIAHHDGLQPTQHVVVWSLPPKGDSEGPTFISRTAPTPGGLPYLLIKTSVHRSWRTPRRSLVMSGSSEIPWPLAATTDENGDARPSSALIGACEPVSEIDAGAFPAPRTVCCEHAFQRRFLGWPCRAPPAQAIR
jgi:hypothetical protein